MKLGHGPCAGKDGVGTAGRASGVSAPGGGSGAASSTEVRPADRSFCDAALLALLVAPGRAELFAEMAWQVGFRVRREWFEDTRGRGLVVEVPDCPPWSGSGFWNMLSACTQALVVNAWRVRLVP